MTDAAGREMDEAVAREVMGLRVLGLAWCCWAQDGTGYYVVGDNKPGPSVQQAYVYADPAWDGEVCPGEALIEGVPACWCKGVPEYSTDIAAAFEVVSKMSEMGFGFDLKSCLPAKHWYAHFCKIARVTISKSEYGDTVPHAISLAALACVRGRGGESK